MENLVPNSKSMVHTPNVNLNNKGKSFKTMLFDKIKI